MKLLNQLFDLYDKPLLLVRQNGTVVRANVSSKTQWPQLIRDEKPFVWELDAHASKEAFLSFLSNQAAEHSAQNTAAGSRTLTFRLSSAVHQNRRYSPKLLDYNADEYLLELELTAEETRLAAPLAPYLNAILAGINDQMVAVLDPELHYLAYTKAYAEEYARIFAVKVKEGDHLLETLKHLPGEQEKALAIWQQVLLGESFRHSQTFGHDSLRPTTYSFEFTPLKNEQGELFAILYIVKDVSKQEASTAGPDVEERFRTLAENTPDVVMRLDPQLRVLFVNGAVTRETGRAPAEYSGISLYQLPNVERVPETFFHKIRQTFQTKQESDLVSSFRNEGRESDYFTRFVPEISAEGEVVSVLAISRNISELRRAQLELQQAQDFVFMAEVIPQLIWITEPNGDICYFNQHWYAYTGISKEDSQDWGWQKVVHPQDLQHSLTEWDHALQSGEPFEVEQRFRRHDGEYRWFLSRAMPMRNEAGAIVKWYGFSADIHERYRYRQQLSDKAQELQMLNQMIPQLVWATEANGDHDFFNQLWYDYTGVDYEDSMNQGWSHVLHPDDYARTLEAWNHSLKTGDPYQIEYRLRRHDGVYRWFIGRANPQYDVKGNILKWFGTCTDIHDYKQQREELAQKNLELQQLNVYLDQFVHTAAHDLRAPVANMKLLYDMLMREENAERHKKLLQTFKPLLNRLDKTIVGLVEIVQMQEGHSTLRVQEVDPEQVLEEVKEELFEQITEADVVLEQQISLGRPLCYLRPYLTSILRNLLSNSLKYRDAGRPLHIRITGDWQGKYYRLKVEDSGSGIDLQRHGKNLFRPFKRLSVKSEGLGIGLHMVQNMVQKNGGYIEVESAPNVGTTFTLLLHPYESVASKQPEVEV